MRGGVRFHRALRAGLSLGLLTGVSPVRSSEEDRPARPGLFRPWEAYGPGRHRNSEVDRWARVIRDETGRRITLPRPDSQDPPRPKAREPLRTDVPEPAAVGLPVALEWHRSTFGTGIGATGLHAVDVDGDGVREIVATASGIGFFENTFWYVLEHENGEYVHSWTSLPHSAGIQSLRVVNVDADAALEVLVGTGDRIQVYDGATRALEATVTTSASEIRGLRAADIDGDGRIDLVFCDASNLYVYDGVTGAPKWTASGLGGEDLAVGNVDDDSALEIVVGRGSSTGYIVDGASQAVEWANSWGFGDLVRLGELDGDGRQEVVSGYYWDGIRIFDAEAHSLAASVSVFNLGSLQVVDVEGDGPLEIVYGDGQWGSVRVLDGATRAEKWAVENPGYGTTEVAVGDVDDDGVNELIWAAGYSGSGADNLYVLDTVSRVQEWKSLDFNGPFLALSYGDVDADGRSEILSGSFESDSGYGDGLIFVHDALSHDLEYVSGPTTGLNWTGLWRIRNANVDGDPQQEIFVTTSETYDGILICYDGLTHAEQWRATIPDGLTFGSMAVADVDNDGQLEVVAGVNVEHSGAPGVSVYVFNAATGALEWQSPSLSGLFASLSLLRIANVDGDTNPEIVVARYVQSLYVIDGVTHTVQNLGAHEVTALETVDRDGNGVAEIVIGTDDGQLQVLEPLNGAVVETIGAYSGPIDGLAVADVTGDSARDYVFGAGGEVRIYDGAMPHLLLWSSGVIGDRVGFNDSLLVADVDADGSLELMVNLGYTGFRVYEAAAVTLSVGDASVAEGHAGQTPAHFTVTLSAPSSQDVSVHYSTADGSAAVGSDYQAVSGVLTIPATQTSGVVSVPVVGDTASEGNETFSVILSAAAGAAILDGEATGLILDDEAGPALSIEDVTVTEGETAFFTVTLSPVNLSQTVTVDYRTAGGTATPDLDFVPRSGTLTFFPGFATLTISVPVHTDTAIDGGETFAVDLSNATHAVIADPQGTGTILDGSVEGDFDGSGRTDILWRDEAAGHIAAWFMDGTTMTGGVLVDPSPFTPLSWKIVGTADFNDDNKVDILWRDQAGTGRVAIWYMDGTTMTGAVLTEPPSAPPLDWRIVGTGDFNGDGRPDILWRDEAKTGQIAVWFMKGRTRTGSVLTTPGSFPLLNWEIAGVGDFNRDRQPDILWRDTKSTGQLAVWFMSGTTQIGATLLTPGSFPLLNWEIQGVGDYNADGQPDILWRDQTGTGRIAVWFMDGTTMTSATLTDPPAFTLLNWRIVGPK